ncbi:TonB family protein [Bacteroidota bacterium]
MRTIISLFFALTLLIQGSQAQIDLVNSNNIPDEDKTLSPYFEVISDNPDVDKLPLYLTKANVNIVGVIADVTVTQIYKNEGKNPLEAIYVFPASTKAAVYGMTMTIGDRVLKAEIQERQQARETYEKAKKEGKSASLLEQQRPNVFQMNVANIMPGDSIIVELKYTELLVPVNKTYEFMYPTVVGPRYSNKSKDSVSGKDSFVETPYKHEGEKPDYKFDININLTTGVPLQEVTCATHKLNVDKIDVNQANIELDKSDEFGGNKDFILNYKLSGDKIETGLILSEGNDEKFFLLMLQPPKKIEPKNIPPREYIFVVDVSGSMHGFPLDVSKEVMRNLLSGLKPDEKFNILFFAGGSDMLFEESVAASTENLNKANLMLDNMRGSGGTELLPAMEKVFKFPKDAGFSRTILVITDGYIDVEAETFDLIRNNLNDANVFAFGIGNGVNRFLIEGMARVGYGEPFIITNSREAKEQAGKFQDYVKSPLMTDINIEYDRFSTYDVEPKSIPDVFADRPIIIFGKWEDLPEGNIRVSGKYGKERYHVDINVLQFGTRVNNDALKYLWARNKIAIINDYASLMEKETFKKEVIDLGLKYNLLTDYTSFVAVDYISRNNGDSIVTVKQALPLPEGVSDYAVGGYSMMAQGRGAASPMMHKRGLTVPLGLTAGSSGDAMILSETENIELRTEPLVDLKTIQKNVKYPEAARKAGIEGKVIIRTLIGKNGIPTNPQVVYSDNSLLDSAAMRAILKTKFAPAQSNGNPTTAWVSVPISFKLADKEDFKIEAIRKCLGKATNKGDKITFHYIFYYGTGEYFNSYKENKPVSYILGEDEKYKLIDSWFKGMKVGEKIRIEVPRSKQIEIEKLFNGANRKTNIIFEIELIKIE